MKTLKTLKTYTQQAWNEQSPVTIRERGIVTVDGYPVYTPREKALACIILQLNAQNIYLKEDIEKTRVGIEELKKEINS